MARVATKDASLDTHVRACSLAIGSLSPAKKADIIAIKAGYVTAVNFFHNALWVPFLSDSDRDLKTKANALQKGLSKKLKVNSAYIEKAKISTLDNILEQRKRSLRCFFGKLRNIDSKIEPDKDTGSVSDRTYYNLHNDISALCTPADFDQIKSLFGEKVALKARMKMLRDIVDKKSCKGWSSHQIAMVNAIHDDVTARFSKPSSQAADYVATIHLDYRLLTDIKDQCAIITQQAHSHFDKNPRLLIDKTNAHYHYFLEVSNATPGNDKIRIPFSINPETLKKFMAGQGECSATSIALFIGDDSLDIRVMVSKAEPVKTLGDVYRELKTKSCIIGRDFGYTNTITLSVIKNEFDLSLDEFVARQALKKDECRSLYTSGTYSPEVIETITMSGKPFMDSVSKHCDHISKLVSNIDTIYNKIETILPIIKDYQDMTPDDKLTRESKSTDPYINHLIAKFWRLFNQVHYLRKMKRRLYAKIAGLKKSWFGYLSSLEISLAKKHNAFLVNEDLTVLAVERKDPNYKGRVFNKMLNNGCKGMYMRCAEQKFQWNGIPLIKIPAYYSSRAIIALGVVVDKKFRKGEVLTYEGNHYHADQNAAMNIASFLLLGLSRLK